MNLCSDNHDEVCFEGRECPACNVISEKDSEIQKLQSEIDNTEPLLQELRDQAQGYKDELIQAQSEVQRLISGKTDGEL
jgi:F0F1-type ATP synthase membrane subunit b/b'